MSGASFAASHPIESEFRFLDKLGTLTPHGRKIGRGDCLRRYLWALERRTKGFNGRDLITADERARLRARAQVVLEALA